MQRAQSTRKLGAARGPKWQLSPEPHYKKGESDGRIKSKDGGIETEQVIKSRRERKREIKLGG